MPLHFGYVGESDSIASLSFWAPEQSVLMTMPATHWRNVSKQKLQKSIPLDTSCFSEHAYMVEWVDWVVFFANKGSQGT